MNWQVSCSNMPYAHYIFWKKISSSLLLQFVSLRDSVGPRQWRTPRCSGPPQCFAPSATELHPVNPVISRRISRRINENQNRPWTARDDNRFWQIQVDSGSFGLRQGCDSDGFASRHPIQAAAHVVVAGWGTRICILSSLHSHSKSCCRWASFVLPSDRSVRLDACILYSCMKSTHIEQIAIWIHMDSYESIWIHMNPPQIPRFKSQTSNHVLIQFDPQQESKSEANMGQNDFTHGSKASDLMSNTSQHPSSIPAASQL